MDQNEIVLGELLEDDDLNNLVIGGVAIDLAQPLNIINNNIQQRAVVPRNLEYYEETIPQYLGDLFVEHFRMSRECFEQLLTVVGNNAQILDRRIPLEKKLMFTIWILSKPESFLAVGDRFGVARSTAHVVFKEIVTVIVALMNQYIIWPERHHSSIRAFHEQSHGFPGVIGAIDGCHIQIKQPIANAHDYYNRKQVHSIVLQAICNHKRLFTDIYVGMPGRVHDARVFRTSPIYARIVSEQNPLLPNDCHILGDSAYPLLKNLLTPFRDNGHLDEDHIRYNIKLSTIRAVIERAFGRLKGKFRRLKYLDISEPDFGIDIITAACVLHNFTILAGDDFNEDEDEIEVDDHMIAVHGGEEIPIPDNHIGILKRNAIVNILRN